MATYSFERVYIDKDTLTKDGLLLCRKLKYLVEHLCCHQRIVCLICAEDIEQIGGQNEPEK